MKQLCVFLMLAGAAFSAPPDLVIPAEVRPSGQYVTFVPATSGVSVVYVGMSGVDSVPTAVLKDPKTFLLDTRGLAPGRYRFAAVAAGKDGEQSRADFQVVVGDAPTPPAPPAPPAPDDPLAKALQAAYASEADPQKAALAKSLAALYRQAGAPAFLSGVPTWGSLFDAMRAAAQSLGVAGKLPAVQAAVASEFKARLPSDRSKPLDADGRALASAAFSRAASLLEGLK